MSGGHGYRRWDNWLLKHMIFVKNNKSAELVFFPDMFFCCMFEFFFKKVPKLYSINIMVNFEKKKENKSVLPF